MTSHMLMSGLLVLVLETPTAQIDCRTCSLIKSGQRRGDKEVAVSCIGKHEPPNGSY